ncbi:hypothetical protein H6G33_09505 [Calothrix sp. FACHB-1219]|uniref:hypothetical protein n=1 Tax=unclassified Calothrix TaxID=2619626 RepID=UPI0016886C0E|nr:MULTISPECIES: hypothetical protein [unclassified Calothrix]MBD2201582.1 hypothetical protein [Calothrix sp. FACHB-168]MBD2217268.1 hypothetical protein [Calothrix sp. FACHB-1219]
MNKWFRILFINRKNRNLDCYSGLYSEPSDALIDAALYRENLEGEVDCYLVEEDLEIEGEINVYQN